MAERITITPEELRSSANVFLTQADQISEILKTLEKEVESLESTWEGAAQDQFLSVYQTMSPEFMKMATQVLPGISNTLNSIAQKLEETDEQIASSLRQ